MCPDFSDQESLSLSPDININRRFPSSVPSSLIPLKTWTLALLLDVPFPGIPLSDFLYCQGKPTRWQSYVRLLLTFEFLPW